MLFNFFYSSIIESSVIFLIISSFLLIEFNLRDLLTQEIFKSVLERAYVLSLIYVVTFKFAKTSIVSIISSAANLFTSYKKIKISLYDIFLDIYVSLVFILTTVPIRPILQKVHFENGKPIFDQALVKFDGHQTAIILAVAAIPFIFFVIKKYSGRVRIFNITAIGISIVLVALINNKPNYEARIYESRADWIIKNWQQQGIDAQKALLSAKTDKEKAIAYYWLGVAEGRQGNYTQDINYQLEAVKLDPFYAAPYSSLSLMYLQTGDDEKAKLSADKCIQLDPKYAWCYYAKFAYLDKSGDVKGAFEYLQKAIELDPNAPDFQNSLKIFKAQNPEITN